MKLSNFSDNKIKEIYSVDQHPSSDKTNRILWKPQGLFLSVDGDCDWEWWCEVEGFRNTKAQYKYQINFKPDAKVLYLTTVEEIIAFTEKYSTIEIYPGALDRYPDWERLAQEYQAIIIAPYQWSLRMEMMWYYTWDCASGVVWDKDAVESFKLVRKPRWRLWTLYVARPIERYKRRRTMKRLPKLMQKRNKDIAKMINPENLSAWDFMTRKGENKN